MRPSAPEPAISRQAVKTIWDIIPILVPDVWKRAYLLENGTNRSGYTSAWWLLIDWRDVEYRAISTWGFRTG